MALSEWVAILASLVAVGSLVVSGLALGAARRSADAATEQVALQRALAVEAAQPYVWADLRVDEVDGDKVDLVVGNSGPSVARRVRVVFDPPLPSIEPWGELNQLALERLERGLETLGPGRTLSWGLGVGPRVVEQLGDTPRRVLVNADGPHGPCEPNSYNVNLWDIAEASVRPQGSLHRLTKSVDALRRDLKPHRPLRQPRSEGTPDGPA